MPLNLQYGISSPAAVLATVDLLSGGRLNPGVSMGPPTHFDQVRGALYPDTADAEDFGYGRVERLLDSVRGKPVTDFSGTEGFETFSDRVQPHSPGLGGRARHEPPHQQRRQGRGASGPLRLRGDPAGPDPRLPGRPPRR
ncbi:hypothetical protein GCM10010383_68700 [Streptomyces lomondensis]|uniref:Uncharacterized protein n=1 Tax=Streptomyces lomondensis TaxID=68229 RepID=A0ABQ2XPU6_9ACTN|nr:hypothetical protein GCM10010383_68700 [Streptomyces lomondensis]